MPSSRQQEVDRNYQEFQKLLPVIINQHRDQFALMKDGAVVAYFSTVNDATTAASKFIPDGIYSVQQVTMGVIDLGFYNYSVPIN